MPWTSADVDKFKQGLSRKQKKKWANIANGVLASCAEDGGKDCEGKAVRIANSNFERKEGFNPIVTTEKFDELMDHVMKDMPEESKAKIKQCMANGGSMKDCHEKEMSRMKMMSEAVEMEIFRAGTHNGDEFTEQDLAEIAENFGKLRDEVRPSLKITHRDNQETLAGLARYGDVVDVFLKDLGDGAKRLFAKVANVPDQVRAWIKDRRFPERSIEIYPEFRVGTKDGAPVYRNVLKAIALLGHEMPAVTGMAPIKLSENYENQKTVCLSSECVCQELADAHFAGIISEIEIKTKGAL